MLTDQQIFEKVATHLLKQNRQCSDSIGCRYYDENTGHKCAVGCLIPLERYRSSHLEGLSIEGIIMVMDANDPEDPLSIDQEELLDILADVGIRWEHRPTLHLLQQLQEIHDGTDPVNWRADLADLASKRQLTMPVL